MHSIVVRHLYNLHSDPPNKSCTHLTPCRVITASLTIFPNLCFTSPWLFYNCQFLSINPLTFSLRPQTSPSGHRQFVLCVYEFALILLVLFCFRFHVSVKSYGICLSLSTLFHLAQYSLGPSMLLQMVRLYSFLWPSNIPLNICTTSFLPIF